MGTRLVMRSDFLRAVFRLLTGILFIVLATGSARIGAQDATGRRVVVIGAPRSATFIQSASQELANGDLIIASEYGVVLEKVRKIAGEGDVPRRLRVKLLAPHQGSLSSEPIISVVLEVRDGKFEALYWNIVSHSTCLPKQLIGDEPLATEVYGSINGSDRCLSFEMGR
jgi:hypothetical protein